MGRSPLIHVKMGILAGAVWFLALAISLTAAPSTSVAAQSGGRYYPETGHSLDARFLLYFDSNGGVDVFGFPITETFEDPLSGTLVQYTENARLEWVEGSGQQGGVRLAPLGELLGGWHLPNEESAQERSGCKYFDRSGHATCFAFLDFFDRHGGVEFFGLPISEFIIEGERIVQYFQYFRLDWYPEAGSNRQVRVGPLGRAHFRQSQYDPELLKPIEIADNSAYKITEIRPSASVRHPSLAPGSSQEVFLLVQDQNNLPVQDAIALLVVHTPTVDRFFLLPRTDSQGFSQRSLEIDPGSPSATVNLEIWVMVDGLQSVARDSFRIR